MKKIELNTVPNIRWYEGELHYMISMNCVDVSSFKELPNAIKVEKIIYYKSKFYDQNEEAVYVSDPLEIEELEISYSDLKVKPMVRDMFLK